MSMQATIARNWRRYLVALLLAVALSTLPTLTAELPGPLGNFFAQAAYACPIGGHCG